MEAVLLYRQKPVPQQVAGSPESRPKNLLSASQGVKPHFLLIVSNSANTPYLTDTIGYKCRWQYNIHTRYHMPDVQEEFADKPCPVFVIHDAHTIKSKAEPKRIYAKKELDLLCKQYDVPQFSYLKFDDGAGLLTKKDKFESKLEETLRELKLIS